VFPIPSRITLEYRYSTDEVMRRIESSARAFEDFRGWVAREAGVFRLIHVDKLSLVYKGTADSAFGKTRLRVWVHLTWLGTVLQLSFLAPFILLAYAACRGGDVSDHFAVVSTLILIPFVLYAFFTWIYRRSARKWLNILIEGCDPSETIASRPLDNGKR
jgi:hypothetical protein